MRSITVLVVICPCSLVLATPTAVVAAIENAARRSSGPARNGDGQIGGWTSSPGKTGTLTSASRGWCSCGAQRFGERDLSGWQQARTVERAPTGAGVVASARQAGRNDARFEPGRAMGSGADRASWRDRCDACLRGYIWTTVPRAIAGTGSPRRDGDPVAVDRQLAGLWSSPTRCAQSRGRQLPV
jgi:hypothetical protein